MKDQVKDPMKGLTASTSEPLVLGSIMHWEDIPAELELTEELFSPKSREVAKWALKFPGMGPEILTQKAMDSGYPDEAGFYEVATEAYMAAAGQSSHLPPHVEVLLDRMVRRKASDAAEGILVAANDLSKNEVIESMGAPITKAIDAILGLSKSKESRKSWEDLLPIFVAVMKGEIQPMGHTTGIQEFDELFNGVHPEHLIVVSGYPGEGKTVLAAQIAWGVTSRRKNEAKGLFLTMEMTQDQLVKRLWIYAADTEAAAIIDPNKFIEDSGLTPDGFLETVAKGVSRGVNTPLEVQEASGSNVDMLIAAIRREHRKNGLDLVVIDFIQRIRPSADMVKQSREQQLSADANRLADLAKELGITIIVPSQLNKEGVAKHAAAINEAADLHLRIEPQDAQAKGVRVIKDRHYGNSGTVMDLHLNKKFLKFTDAADIPEAAPTQKVPDSDFNDDF